jgi:hypothetical protein
MTQARFAKGHQRRPAGVGRTYTIFVRVNAAELAELERRLRLAGRRELSAYVREAVLAQRPPQAVVPELNRTAWLELAEHLVRLQALVGQLEVLAGRQRGGLAGLVGRGRLEELLAACLAELRTQEAAVQALRRSLLGSEGWRR